MPKLEPIDETFFETARLKYVQSWDINEPAADVWRQLVENPLHWCKTLKINWTSVPPFGVGTTRRVKVLGLLVSNEYYFVWDEGRRNAFYFTDANLPLFKRFGEDYVVEPTGENSCRFTWKLAGEPTAIGAGGKPLLDWLVAGFFKDTTKHFRSSAG
jgi:hypothetical protein